MTDTPLQQRRVAIAGFLVALVIASFCYQQAMGGAFQLDDISNLGGLAQVEDAQSAIDFIVSGTSGPTGRPLALATFAWQAASWDQGPAAFLTFNQLLHLLNATLLAWCLYRTAILRSVASHRAAIVAVIAASAWVLMPLLATASLLVVQRMTTLCALFMFLGLAGYLHARGKVDAAPQRGLLLMSASLAAGTVLATLCKESGLLLPVLVLVLEATLLERPATVDRRRWRTWQGVMLLAPLALLVLYLATRFSYPDWIVARRGFDGGERLLTEARLLWLYLFKAAVGIPGQLGIYQGPPMVSRSLLEPLALGSAVAWLGLGAGVIAWRRRRPLLAFAVLWFLAAHLLESTVLPLELYFEHRNYVAVAGPLFALAMMLATGAPWLRRVSLAAVPLYLALNAFFLFSFASLWGEPSLASRYWAMKYPHSVRAVTTMATYQLAEEGPLRTLQTLDNFVIRHPQHAYLRIQELNLLCLVAAGQDHSQVLGQLDRRLPDVEFSYTAGRMLSQLFSTAAATDCNGIDPATVAGLAERLRANPRYANDPGYNQFHHKLLAGIARQQGDYAATIDHLQKAIAFRPSAELNMMMVTALGGAGDFDAAYDFIEDAHKRSPVNPLRALQWQHELDGLQAYIRELETITE